MRRFLRWRPSRRQVRSAFVGCIMIGVNTSLLTIFVAVGMGPIMANVARVPVANQVRFILHRFVTWRDRKGESAWWRQWYRFQLYKVGLTILQQLVFITLVGFADWDYLVVYVGFAAVSGPLAFRHNERKVFSRPAPQ